MELDKYTIYNGYVTGYGCHMVNRNNLERKYNYLKAEHTFRYTLAPSGGGGQTRSTTRLEPILGGVNA